MLVEEGDTIPADARLIESAALQTAEAALTGESLPVTKDTGRRSPRRSRSATAHNMLFSGTAATYGHGKAIVDRDRHAHRDGPHRRTARGDAPTSRRRCSASSIAPARCSASSSSRSRW